jgi:hypothetical protein
MLAAALAAVVTPGAAGAGCGQQITLLGVTAGDPPVAWITEDIGGDCGFSFLVQLALEPDTVRASVTPLDVFGDWAWLLRGQAIMRAWAPPAADTLDVTDGERQGGDTAGAGPTDADPAGIHPGEMDPARAIGPVIRSRRPPDAAPAHPLPEVTPPPLSDMWHAEFLEHLDEGGSDAVTWNDEWGAAGIEPPLVDGEPAHVVYAYPHGLYVNYDIASIHELSGGYLLVVTSQPALGLLLNTMHGFLVVRTGS